MPRSLEEIKRTNLFIRSSADDYQDPVFLTFTIDFFPQEEDYPRWDGLSNSNLLSMWIEDKTTRSFTGETEATAPSSNLYKNSAVEFSAFQWLSQYYGVSKNAPFNSPDRGVPKPAAALARFSDLLKEIQDNPWYIQSIQGIGDLWKGLHRVKEGNQKTTLTLNCIDSIKQPLTEMAENYRYAVYDNDRLAYRLPDNLRWFDMVITLVEIRDIADYSGQFFYDAGDNLAGSGLRAVQFKCKMCEFDFSNFLGGSTSDHKVYTEEKPFSPSFNINVGWVIQEEVPLKDAEDYRQLGMFAGALSSLNNKITRLIQTATRLPGAIVGSVLNNIQTMIEKPIAGNVYKGFNDFLSDLNEVSGNLTGRRPAVGPPVVSNVGSDIYPNDEQPAEVDFIDLAYSGEKPVQPITISGDSIYEPVVPTVVTEMDDIYQPVEPAEVDEMGDIYPGDQPNPTVAEMDDVYEDVPGVQVENIGDIYEDVPPVEVNEIGDVYQDVPGTQVEDIGDVYPDEPPAPNVSDMGDLYQDVPGIQVEDIGDVYPDEPAAEPVSDMGDLYQDVAGQQIDFLGDLYPDQNKPESISDMGDTYPEESQTEDVADLGDIYRNSEDNQSVEDLGDVYQDVPAVDVDSIGDVYQDKNRPDEVDDLGGAYKTDN